MASHPTPQFPSLHDYVTRLGGVHKRVITRVLIANNGIAAVKAIRSIRKWAYETFGNERAIFFYVMTTPEDLRANAEYIRMADAFVEVGGGTNNNNFANVRLIVETAESVGADAVWAGWGHASENPALPDSLAALSRPIAFIGPPSGPMHALGDKIGSTIIAQSANVPCMKWNGDGITIDYKTDGLPEEIYAKANLTTVESAVEAAAKVGFPLMVKASEGGGGKGIRKVLDAASLPAAYRQVASEVPGSPIFIMALANNSRHLEVQVLADVYGDAIALMGRDCSVQRRHQKIVEEGPVTAASPETWAKMEDAAVRLAKEVGYVNAGTVEYLYLEDTKTFAFLELNPRLQVEHPVTEMITGVNLPAAQLQVAMGIPLCHIPDIRKLYDMPPFSGGTDAGSAVESSSSTASAAVSSTATSSTSSSSSTGNTASTASATVSTTALVQLTKSPIDFDARRKDRISPQGHVIAARITAENPDIGFQPTSGAVTELNFRSTPDVWGYFSVDSSGRVHEFADSQIGHLFAWGTTREDARQHMVLALKELSIRGDIRTTTEYLVHLMESTDFRLGKINTAWLDGCILRKEHATKPDAILVAMAGAVWRAHSAYDQRRSDFIGYCERGQYPPPSLLAVEDAIELIYEGTKYSLRSSRSAPNCITLSCNGTSAGVDFRHLSDGGLLLVLGGVSHVIYGRSDPDGGLRLIFDGATCQFTAEYDPTQLRASMSGKLARFLVEDGSHLAAGEAYAEVEVMKMYMPLLALEAGVISLVIPEGGVLDPGDLIATVALDDPSKVQKASPYEGPLLVAVLGGGASHSSSSSSPSAASINGESGVGAGAMTSLSLVLSPLPPAGTTSDTTSTTTTATSASIPAPAPAATVPASSAGSTSATPSSSTSTAISTTHQQQQQQQQQQRRWNPLNAARNAQRILSQLMAGFSVPKPEVERAWVERDAAYASPELPCLEVEGVMAVLSSRLPPALVAKIVAVIADHKASHRAVLSHPSTTSTAGSSPVVPLSNLPVLSVAPISAAVEATFERLSSNPSTAKEANAFAATVAPLREVLARYKAGLAGANRSSLFALLREYVAVEALFGSGKRPEDSIADLRGAAGGNRESLSRVFDVMRAHANIKMRNATVLACLARVGEELELYKMGMQAKDSSSSSSAATAAAAAAAAAREASGDAVAAISSSPPDQQPRDSFDGSGFGFIDAPQAVGGEQGIVEKYCRASGGLAADRSERDDSSYGGGGSEGEDGADSDSNGNATYFQDGEGDELDIVKLSASSLNPHLKGADPASSALAVQATLGTFPSCIPPPKAPPPPPLLISGSSSGRFF